MAGTSPRVAWIAVVLVFFLHDIRATVILNNAILSQQLVQEGKVRVGVIVLRELFSLQDITERIQIGIIVVIDYHGHVRRKRLIDH